MKILNKIWKNKYLIILLSAISIFAYVTFSNSTNNKTNYTFAKSNISYNLKLNNKYDNLNTDDYSGYVLYNLNKDQILAQNNLNTKLNPASLTKLVTNSILWDEINKGNISTKDQGASSKSFVAINKTPIYSFAAVKPSWDIYSLSQMSILQSANDATSAIGAKIGGNEQNFVQIMQNYLENKLKINPNEFEFYSSSGLTNRDFEEIGVDNGIVGNASNVVGQNKMSPNALLKVLIHIFKTQPRLVEILKQHDFTYEGVNYKATWVPFMDVLSPYFAGGKSGAHPLAHPSGTWGYSYAGIYKKDNQTYLSVVLDSKNSRSPLMIQSQFLNQVNKQQTKVKLSNLVKNFNNQHLTFSVESDKEINLDTTGQSYIPLEIKLNKKTIDWSKPNLNIGKIYVNNVEQGNVSINVKTNKLVVCFYFI